MIKLSGKSESLVAVAIFALCVAPTFISYQPYRFQWDDTDYLQRSVALSRAFWSGNLHGMGVAMVSIRPPAMTFLGLPWGPMTSWHAAGKCFITLAAVISLLAALCLYLLLRIGVKPLFLIIASVCVFASIGPYPAGANAHIVATGFLADSLFAWTTLAAVLLIPYEARVPCPSIRGAIMRGILWGSILSLGAMTKLSFLYFVVLIVPTVFLLKLYWGGLRGAVVAFIAFACWSAPAAIYLVHWGGQAFANAKTSSFGPLAHIFVNPLLPFLSTAIRESPGMVISFVLTVDALIYLVIKKRIILRGPNILPLLIMMGFGTIVLASSNRELRYAFPVIVALPFLLAVLMSTQGDSIPGRFAALGAGLVFCCLLAAGAPTRHRPDRQSISRCDAVLALAARCHARRILVATDSPTFNKNLMDLATEFWATRTPVEVRNLAYNAISGMPIEEDFNTIDESDQVVFQDRSVLGRSFLNERVSEYERHIRQGGHVPVRVGEDLSLYSMRCRP